MDPRSGRGSVAARSATGATDTTPVEIRALGPLEIQVGGEPRTLPGRQERAVLTLLAVHVGEPVSVDRLSSLLWADDPPRTADKSLQTYVSRIRRVIGGDGAVARRESAYMLTLPRGAVDVARFADEVAAARDSERSGDEATALGGYDRALALWRGAEPAATSDTPAAAALREQLVHAHQEAMTARLRLELRTGNEPPVVQLEALVGQQPLREELWVLLVEGYARAGRQAEALAAYQRACTHLASELGLDPSPQLQELQRRILAREIPQGAATSDRRGTPVPATVSRLIGRDADRERVRSALSSSRLVTVVGVGGVGKTTLAVDAVADRSPAAVFCDLSSVDTGDSVGHAMAAAMRTEPEPGEDPVQTMAGRVGAESVVLILDNCEHLLQPVRRIAHVLLGRCPGLRVLATSRQPLGISGETVVTLAPLAIDDAQLLFVERAAEVGVHVGADVTQRELVRAVCTALDGLPLAIELAAPLTRVMTLTDLRRQLGDRLALLGEPRLLGGRERNLPDVVRWSYDLLEPAAQALFRRVSVFHGGFEVDAAGSVSSGDGLAERDIPRLLAGLAERSMLERLDTGRVTRYGLLETMREFGLQALTHEEAAVTRRSHAQWAVRLARALDAGQFTADEPVVIERFERELDNLRAAMRWSVDEGDADVALALVSALHLLASWCLRSEVYGWVQETVDRFGDSGHPLASEAIGALAAWRGISGDRDGVAALVKRLRVMEDRGQPLGPAALEAFIWFAARSGDVDAVDRYLERLRELDPPGLRTMEALGDAAAMRFYMGDVEEARRRTAVLVAWAERSPIPTAQAWAEIGRAIVMHSDEPDAGLAGLRRAIALARTGRRRLVERVAMSAVAAQAARARDPANALAAFGDVLGAWQRDGVWRMEWGTLQSFMELLERLDSHEELLVLSAAGAASATAPPLYGDQAMRLARAVERAERAVGADTAEAARARGRSLSDAQAVAYARSLVARR